MRGFCAFLKKELLDGARSGKLLILGALFLVFGIMNPAIAKLTPWLMEMLSDSLAESGMTVTAVEVNALTSWGQFFKNAPIAWIAFVLMYAGIFTAEYETHTLVMILSKGLARYQVLLAKTVTMLLVWTLCYWMSFGVTCGYNAYFWSNPIPSNLMSLCFGWWLFGVWSVSLIVLCSTLVRGYGNVILLVGGCVFVSYLLSALPKVSQWMPSTLMSGGGMLTNGESIPYQAIIMCAITSVVFVVIGIFTFNKKQI